MPKQWNVIAISELKIIRYYINTWNKHKNNKRGDNYYFLFSSNSLGIPPLLLYFLFQATLICVTWAEGLLETSSLPPRGRGKVCVHFILPRPHLWNYTRYVVVVLGLNVHPGFHYKLPQRNMKNIVNLWNRL